MTEAAVSSNKIWPAEYRKNPLVTGAILWVILPLCLLPLFITRTDKGGLDSYGLKIGNVIQRDVSGVGSRLSIILGASVFRSSSWSAVKKFEGIYVRRKKQTFNSELLFWVQEIKNSKLLEPLASCEINRKADSCLGTNQTSQFFCLIWRFQGLPCYHL